MKFRLVGQFALVIVSPSHPIRTDGSGALIFKAGDEDVKVHQFHTEDDAQLALKKIGSKIDGGTTTVVIDDL